MARYCLWIAVRIVPYFAAYYRLLWVIYHDDILCNTLIELRAYVLRRMCHLQSTLSAISFRWWPHREKPGYPCCRRLDKAMLMIPKEQRKRVDGSESIWFRTLKEKLLSADISNRTWRAGLYINCEQGKKARIGSRAPNPRVPGIWPAPRIGSMLKRMFNGGVQTYEESDVDSYLDQYDQHVVDGLFWRSLTYDIDIMRYTHIHNWYTRELHRYPSKLRSLLWVGLRLLTTWTYVKPSALGRRQCRRHPIHPVTIFNSFYPYSTLLLIVVPVLKAVESNAADSNKRVSDVENSGHGYGVGRSGLRS